MVTIFGQSSQEFIWRLFVPVPPVQLHKTRIRLSAEFSPQVVGPLSLPRGGLLACCNESTAGQALTCGRALICCVAFNEKRRELCTDTRIFHSIGCLGGNATSRYSSPKLVSCISSMSHMLQSLTPKCSVESSVPCFRLDNVEVDTRNMNSPDRKMLLPSDN